MEKVNRAIVEVKNDEMLKTTLYRKDWNDIDDEIEITKVSELEGKNVEFIIGCYEVNIIHVATEENKNRISEIEKEIEETKEKLKKFKEDNIYKRVKETLGPGIGSTGKEFLERRMKEGVESAKRYIEHLKREKNRIEYAEHIEKMVIDYSMGYLYLNYNGINGETIIELNDDGTCSVIFTSQLSFRNMKIKIRKY